MPKTITSRLIRGLQAHGYTHIVGYRSSKYKVFWKEGEGKKYYFVGRAGALRYGRATTRAVSCSTETREKFLNPANWPSDLDLS